MNCQKLLGTRRVCKFPSGVFLTILAVFLVPRSEFNLFHSAASLAACGIITGVVHPPTHGPWVRHVNIVFGKSIKVWHVFQIGRKHSLRLAVRAGEVTHCATDRARAGARRIHLRLTAGAAGGKLLLFKVFPAYISKSIVSQVAEQPSCSFEYFSHKSSQAKPVKKCENKKKPKHS